MIRLLLIAATCGILVGCDRVMSSEPVGEQYTIQTTQSCTYAGYCYTSFPGIGFDGKFQTMYGFRFSPACVGSQKIEAQAQKILVVRESGKREEYEQVVVVTKILGSCS